MGTKYADAIRSPAGRERLPPNPYWSREIRDLFWARENEAGTPPRAELNVRPPERRVARAPLSKSEESETQAPTATHKTSIRTSTRVLASLIRSAVFEGARAGSFRNLLLERRQATKPIDIFYFLNYVRAGFPPNQVD